MAGRLSLKQEIVVRFHAPHPSLGEVMYTQCLLKNGNATQMCWIESQYAQRGLLLGLDACPEETWKVVAVYGEVDRKVLDGQRKAFKTFESKVK